MKLIFILIFSVTLIVPFATFAQKSNPGNNTRLRGTIMDRYTKQPIAYASIGIVDKPAGTVSDSFGHFELVIDHQYAGDTLQVSMVGYYPKKSTVSELTKVNGPITINLTKKVTQLTEVVVTNQFRNTVIVGRQSTGSFLQASIVPKGDKALLLVRSRV